MPKTLCKIIVFLLFISIIAISCSHRTYDYSVPDFTLPDIYGKDVRLYEVLEDSSVMIVVWALWAKICIKELDVFIPCAGELNAMNIKVLAVSVDRARSLPKVRPFAEDHGWPEVYTVLSDTADVVRDLYEIMVMPTTIVINQEGEIVFEWLGYKTGDEIMIMDSLRIIFSE